MSRWKRKYECDRCAACCIYLVPDIREDEIRRESRIALHIIEDDVEKWMDYGGEDNTGCPFLSELGSCSIYATRPDCCKRFEPGSELCQYARGRSGLGSLQPVEWIDSWEQNANS